MVGSGAFTINTPTQCTQIRENGVRCMSRSWKGSAFCGGHQPLPEVAASSNAKLRKRAQEIKDREAELERPLPFANLRTCSALTVAGNQCKAPALRDGEHCRSHAAKKGVATVNAAMRVEQRDAREHLLKAIKVEIAKDPRRVFGVLIEGLSAMRVVYDSKAGRHVESDLPDWTVRLACFRELCDRVYGKSTNRVEHSGPNQGPITMAAIIGDADQFAKILNTGDAAELEAWYEQIEDAEEAPLGDGEKPGGTILAPGSATVAGE